MLQALETNSVVRVIQECLPSIQLMPKLQQVLETSELAEETVGLLDFLSKNRGTKGNRKRACGYDVVALMLRHENGFSMVL